MLALHGIRKAFGKRQVLTGLDLELKPGEIYGLLGPNGAGKSTTLKIATGLVHADAGTVDIDGIRLRRGRLDALRRVGAQIDQPSFPTHLSARANLEILAELSSTPRADVDRHLRDVRLHERADDRFGTFSTGMKQRLGIAAAMLGDPPLLILDEPTSGLDPDGRRDILTLIRSLADRYGPTVLFTSHVFDEIAELCDRAGILHDGVLADELKPESSSALRDRYFAVGASAEGIS